MTPEVLEEWINSDADLWGIFQPYYHLLSGRTVYGITDTIDTYAAPKLKGLFSLNCLSFWTNLGDCKPLYENFFRDQSRDLDEGYGSLDGQNLSVDID